MHKTTFFTGSSRPVTNLLRLALSVAALWPLLSHGVRTESVIHEAHGDFLSGTLKDVSLHRDGRLTLAPAASLIASLPEAVIWSATAGPDGSVFVGAGNEGKVFRLSSAGELEELFATEEVFVRAMALDAEGRLYVGTSPDGKVYRHTMDGETEEFFDPRETYIWALLFGPEGDLFVATGEEGRIYRIPAGAEGKLAGEVYFDSDETHISTLARDGEGRLLAGTSPNGYVYRVDEAEKAFLLFNSPDEEVRKVLPGEEGELYVATFSGSPSPGGEGASGSSALAQAVASLAAKEEEETEAGAEEKPASRAASSSGRRPSTLYRVDADGFHEPFWGLPEVSIHSLLKLEDGPLLIGTGNEGRIFSLAGFQSWKLRQTLPTGSEVSAILRLPETEDVVVFTSNPARIYRLDFGLAGEGEFISAVYDAEQVARWGRLYTEGTGVNGDNLQAFVRSGNTEKADGSWTSWQPVDATGKGGSDLPPARYFQYRLAFGDADAEVRRVRFFYRHANAAPVIQALRVVTADLGLEKFELPPQQPSIDLDQLFRTSRSRSSSAQEPRQQIRAYERPGTVTVAWRARDPNEDDLTYTVKLRQLPEGSWSTIGEDVKETFFSFNGNGFPEGAYQVRIEASDRLSNPRAESRQARRESETFAIDNTAPEIRVKEMEVSGSAATVLFRASDEISLVAAADFILNGGEPVALSPEDGLFDASEEAFRIELEKLTPGRYTLLIRVADEARNPRTHQVAVEVKE